MKGRLNLWLLAAVGLAALSYGFGRDRDSDAGGTPERRVPVEDAPTTGVAAPPAAETPAAPVHLVVLNGTPRAGLARDIGLLLGPAGCVVQRVGNATHDRFAKSFLVNRRLPPARAADLATRLGGVPVLKEFDPRTTADAVLVLGRDADRIGRELKPTGGPGS